MSTEAGVPIDCSERGPTVSQWTHSLSMAARQARPLARSADALLGLVDEVFYSRRRLVLKRHPATASDVCTCLGVHLQGLPAHDAGHAEQVVEAIHDDVVLVAELFLHQSREIHAHQDTDGIQWRVGQDECHQAAWPEAAQIGGVVVLAHDDREAEGDVQACVRLLQAIEDAQAPAAHARDLVHPRRPHDDLGVVNAGEDEHDEPATHKVEGPLVESRVRFHNAAQRKARNAHAIVCVQGVLHPSAIAVAPRPLVALRTPVATALVVAPAVDHAAGRRRPQRERRGGDERQRGGSQHGC
mmetsp:Transcript_21851/g.60832  ORF Transcript_21851/g.60832 Transcript_21851/m.60832 type:complete len:299 (+) Transcript_21851:3-899(+)